MGTKESAKERTCPNCGCYVSDKARFCEQCGESVGVSKTRDTVSFFISGDWQVLSEALPGDALVQALLHDHPDKGQITLSKRVYEEFVQKVNGAWQQALDSLDQGAHSQYVLSRKLHTGQISIEEYEQRFADTVDEMSKAQERCLQLELMVETILRSAETDGSSAEGDDDEQA